MTGRGVPDEGAAVGSTLLYAGVLTCPLSGLTSPAR